MNVSVLHLVFEPAEHDIDPIEIPDVSLYNHMTFTDNAVLKTLRDEYHEPHARKVAARLRTRPHPPGKKKY